MTAAVPLPVVLAAIPRVVRGERGEVRVSVEQWRAYPPCVHVRLCLPGKDGTLRPTRAGVTLRASDLSVILAALNQAAAVLGKVADVTAPTETAPTATDGAAYAASAPA